MKDLAVKSDGEFLHVYTGEQMLVTEILAVKSNFIFTNSWSRPKYFTNICEAVLTQDCVMNMSNKENGKPKR